MTDKDKRELAADIGDEALDFEAGPQREAFVEGKCGGDAELAQYVRRYLTDFKQVFASRDQASKIQTAARKIPFQRGPVKPAQPQILNGRYKLVRLLGSGGMGKVFQAIDIETGKPLAIKAVRSAKVRSEDDRMRLVREARAAGQLQHPNIVAVHDIGQNKGALYIVMEYVEGSPLINFVAAQAHISLRTKLSIMAQVADALHYAHLQGVFHRDVKPHNILVLRDQSVKVVDFGLAGQADLPNSLVQNGGTFHYMSPEQFGRQNPDERSDIWSTGVTLFQFLTGNLPFRNRDEILSAPTPVLPKEFPLSGELNAILARTMAKDPEMRYRTADELARDLRQILQIGESANPRADRPTLEGSSGKSYVLPNLNFAIPTTGELTTREGKLNEWNERKRVLLEPCEAPVVVFAAVVLMMSAYDMFSFGGVARFIGFVILLAIPVLALVWTAAFITCCFREILDGIPRCRGCLQPMRRTAWWTRLCQSREEVTYGYRDSMAALKHGLWQDAAKLLSIHGAADAAVSINYLVPPARFHLNFFECGLCGHHAARLTTDEMVERNWEQHPGFGEVYWGSAGPSLLSGFATSPMVYLRLVPEFLESVRIRRILIIGAAAMVAAVLCLILGWLTFSYTHPYAGIPHVNYGPQRAIDHAEMARDEAMREPLKHAIALYANRPDEALAWLAKGLRQTVAGGKDIYKHPDSTLFESWIAPQYESWITIALSSHSWPLPVGPAFQQVGPVKSASPVWDEDTGYSLGMRLQHSGEVYRAAFSPDSRRVVTASADRTARIWDAETGKPIGPPLEHDGAVTSAAFSRDGKRVVTTSEDKTARIWEAETGKPIGAPLRHESAVTSAAFSPNGRRLVTASKDLTTRVWDTDSGRIIGRPLHHARAVTVTPDTFSPNGRRIVAVSRNSNSRIVWDVETGQPAGPLLENATDVHSETYSPDGFHVITLSDGAVLIWDADTGRRVQALMHESFVQWAGYSPDGHRIVTVTAKDIVRLWNADTGRRIGLNFPYRGEAGPGAFSPDGQRIVTFYGHTTSVWETDTEAQIGPVFLTRDFVDSAAFSPDGRRIVIASGKSARIVVVRAGLNSREEAGQLADLAEVLGGLRINDSGAPVPLAPAYRSSRLRALRSSTIFSSLHIF